MKRLTAVLLLCLSGACSGNREEGKEMKLVSVNYRCEGGAVVKAEYDNESSEQAVFLQLHEENPEKIRLTLTRSASGARYSDGKLVWWTKGNTAFLTNEEGSETLYADCVEFSAE